MAELTNSMTAVDGAEEIFEVGTFRYLRVRSLDHLKKLAEVGDGSGCAEFILLLNGGFRRTKLVQFGFNKNGRHWYVDDMDDARGSYYTTPQLISQTMIPRAIVAGCFYLSL